MMSAGVFGSGGRESESEITFFNENRRLSGLRERLHSPNRT